MLKAIVSSISLSSLWRLLKARFTDKEQSTCLLVRQEGPGDMGMRLVGQKFLLLKTLNVVLVRCFLIIMCFCMKHFDSMCAQ